MIKKNKKTLASQTQDFKFQDITSNQNLSDKMVPGGISLCIY